MVRSIVRRTPHLVALQHAGTREIFRTLVRGFQAAPSMALNEREGSKGGAPGEIKVIARGPPQRSAHVISSDWQRKQRSCNRSVGCSSTSHWYAKGAVAASLAMLRWKNVRAGLLEWHERSREDISAQRMHWAGRGRGPMAALGRSTTRCLRMRVQGSRRAPVGEWPVLEATSCTKQNRSS